MRFVGLTIDVHDVHVESIQFVILAPQSSAAHSLPDLPSPNASWSGIACGMRCEEIMNVPKGWPRPLANPWLICLPKTRRTLPWFSQKVSATVCFPQRMSLYDMFMSSCTSDPGPGAACVPVLALGAVLSTNLHHEPSCQPVNGQYQKLPSPTTIGVS